MPEHGGRLREAAQDFGVPLERWLDLSTGVNPSPWPVDPASVGGWERLPEPDDRLIDVARETYGVTRLLPVAGSMAAIGALPRLFPAGPVTILAPTFNEHAAAWERAGHTVSLANADQIDDMVDASPVVVVCNPNNPTGHRFDRATLIAWSQRLAKRGGALIVDEAFIDATPEASVAPNAGPGLIVLRSLGKFYGLAGARVGFVMGEETLLDRLDDQLGPWGIAGPSRVVAMAALQDEAWRRDTVRRLHEQSARLERLLTDHDLAPTGGTPLFQWVITDRALPIHDALARRGILVRRFGQPASLRFGLPGDDDQWRRLDDALAEARR